ncbi:hypothetical protein OAH12_02515 [Cyclobacteriaceae bacterium]|nr:hypothetical protein [Cyclobacteriaceae bacterium]
MDKVLPYVRPLIIVVFGLTIWIRGIETFVPSWVTFVLCLIYGGVRTYFVWKKNQISEN